MTREIDIKIAEKLGWVWKKGVDHLHLLRPNEEVGQLLNNYGEICEHDTEKIIYPHLPCWSTDMGDAMKLLVVVKSMKFSQRLGFFAYLRLVINMRCRQTLQWPDAMVFMKPNDLCLAFLTASNAEGDIADALKS
jgi:hypothetical protein